MKKIIAALVLCMSFQAAFADHHEEGGGNFEERKKMMLEGIDKRIAGLNSHKSCVSAAADKAAMKKCHESAKSMREDYKEMHKEKREKMKNMRKEKKK